ncbi:MAG: trypsin-like serine protease [Myxococcota bacterium]
MLLRLLRSSALLCAVLGVAILVSALPVGAVLIDTGDGSGNTTPPTNDPGFDNVGVASTILSAVYVRNGWVLTANHVGEGPVTFLGTTYEPIVGSVVRFQNPDTTFADLIAFKLQTRPQLPDLAITDQAPSTNGQITIIGNGRNRGAATSWNGIDGYTWGTGHTKRWGTNRIEQTNQVSLDTQSFWIEFDDLRSPGSQHESDIVTGDSGGAAFIGSGNSAELVGILFARAGFVNQPTNTSLYGNVGVIVDLFAYRSDILAVIDQPDCDDGLDDDGDGLVDYPADPGCTSPTDTSEREATLACDNELDDDGDGTIDLEDPGCTDPGDTDERGPLYECDNGLDDDLDTFADFPNDSGCLHPTNLYELPAPEPAVGWPLALGTLSLASAARRRRTR